MKIFLSQNVSDENKSHNFLFSTQQQRSTGSSSNSFHLRRYTLDNAGPNTSWPINAAIHLISNKSHVSILTVQFYVWENSRRRPFTFRLFHFCFIFLLFSSSCLAGPIEWTRANECEIINKIVYGNNANWMRMWDRETSEAGQAVREMTNSEKMDICFVIL